MHSGLILPPLGTSHSSSNSSSSFGVLPSKWGSAAVTTFPTAVLASTGAYEAEHNAARASLTSASWHKNPIQLQEFMGIQCADTGETRIEVGFRRRRTQHDARSRGTDGGAEGVRRSEESEEDLREHHSAAGGELRKSSTMHGNGLRYFCREHLCFDFILASRM